MLGKFKMNEDITYNSVKVGCMNIDVYTDIQTIHTLWSCKYEYRRNTQTYRHNKFGMNIELIKVIRQVCNMHEYNN